MQLHKGDGVMKKVSVALACLLFTIWLLAGCAQKTGVGDQAGLTTPKEAQALSLEEQKKAAYEIFKEILLLSDSQEREQNLPRIKSLYREIIEKYPDIGLAQESYLRLIMLAKEQKTPEGEAEAESLYREFLQRYPDSKLQRIVENELRKE